MKQERKYFNLDNFLERDIYPTLWEVLASAFPEFGFRHKGQYWQATDETATRQLPGAPRPSRVYAYKNSPFGFTIQGGEFISWISYICGGISPRGKDFIEAIQKLANLAGVTLPDLEISIEESKKAEDKERQNNLLEDFFSYTRMFLSTNVGKAAYDYLEKRGFSIEQIETLELGFYPTTTEIKAFLLSKGYTDEEIGYSAYEVENLAKPIGSGVIYDGRWANRIIGVWRDRNGRIINLWARDLTNKAQDHEKYLMVKNGSKKFPFGIDKVIGENLILVEGFLDALSLQTFNLLDVVALGGASLGIDQIQALASIKIKSLTLNLDYDGDKICKHGNERPRCLFTQCNITLAALEALKESPFQVFVINPALMVGNNHIREKVDPDTFIRKEGLEKYFSLLENKHHAYRYKAQVLIEKHKQDNEWTDTSTINLLNEAIEFSTSITKAEKLRDLDIFFWPELFSATNINNVTINNFIETIQIKKKQEQEQHNYESLIYELGKVLKDKGVVATKNLLKEQANRLEVEEKLHRSEPILSLAQELEAHNQRLIRWQGKEFIGLAQKTLPTLDKATLGLRGLMLLAAAPNVGKTALAVQLGLDIVKHNSDACFFFLSLEMSRWDIISRIKCQLAKLDWATLMFGSQPARGRGKDAFYTHSEWQRLTQAEETLASLGNRIYILDEQNFSAPTVETLLHQLNTVKEATGTSRAFLLIDYLQVWPIPKSETQIRSELDADKWRIGAMKTLRDSAVDDAILVISEARKPSGNDKIGWGGELADIMGSARGSYTPDIVFILRPFNNDELGNVYDIGLKPNEEQLSKIKDKMKEKGISYNKFIIAKGRDGVLRETMDITFWYRESYFREGIEFP